MFRQFLSDESGTVTTETVIMLPLLIWTYLTLYVFWGAYRATNQLQKATYAIADVISREDMVTPAYLTGLSKVLTYLAPGNAPPDLRVTSVVWSAADKKLKVEWSRSPRGAWLPLTTDTLQAFAGQIPAMTDGNTVVVVETKLVYDAPFDFVTGGFDVSIGTIELQEFIPTRPRIGLRVCMQGVTCVPST